MNLTIKSIIIILVVLLGTNHSFAQKTDKKSESERFIYNPDNFAYTDLRYGYTKLGHHFHSGLIYKYRFNIFKLSYSHLNNFKNGTEESNQINDASIIYGWSFRKKNFLFSIGVGVGGFWGNAITNEVEIDDLDIEYNPQINFKTFGFPLEINFAFTPPPKLKTFSSIGLSFFGNFNNAKSYLGVGLNLSLGKVSPKLTEQQQNDPLRDYYVPKERKQKWYN